MDIAIELDFFRYFISKIILKHRLTKTICFSDETITDGKLRLKKPIITTINRGKEFVYNIVIVTLIAAVLFWTSVFMYGSFYYAFIPLVAHEVRRCSRLELTIKIVSHKS